MMRKEKMQFTLFDIKPIDETGVVEVELERVVLLKKIMQTKNPTKSEALSGTNLVRSPGLPPVDANYTPFSNSVKGGVDNHASVEVRGIEPPGLRVVIQGSHQATPTVKSTYQKEKDRAIELENILNNGLDYKFEFINIGGKIHERPVFSHRKTEEPAGRIVREQIISGHPKSKLLRLRMSKTDVKKKAILSVVIITLGLGVWQMAGNLKTNIVQSGNSAVANLEQAKLDLESFNIEEALSDFSNAHEEFSKAEKSLNFMGNILGSLLAEIPGNSQYKSARNLVEAGKIFSRAGQSLSEAANLISKTALVLNPADSGAYIISDLKQALVYSQADIHKAAKLMADVDIASIPEEKRASFTEFLEKLPEITKLVDDGVDYTRFLENLIAIDDSRKYLILFQNPSELRPTGGFPGSYGVLSFKDGKMEEFKIDDVYNLDGQLKEDIIPPEELQHITPNWGMRDANWFIDFPTSARKMMEFFTKEAGYEVDGVMTFNPLLVGKMLEVLGPVELPNYNLTLTADNFLKEIQAEVEYGDNRAQPKTILYEFGPKLLEKLYTAQPDQWVAIFNSLFASLESGDMPMYFKDLRLQTFALEKGFAGQVKDIPNSDYLMITVTNIKGSKTDIMMDTAVKLESEIQDGQVAHKLSITRKHNGGGHKYGFYNRPNPSYIRILVPDGADLISIEGNSKPSYKPLIDYSKNPDFKKDDDLSQFENSGEKNESGVKIYEESRKTGFGFWMVVEPGETGTVVLEYSVPSESLKFKDLKIKDGKYQLYIQKQPGLNINNFDFAFDLNGKKIKRSLRFSKDLDLKVF